MHSLAERQARDFVFMFDTFLPDEWQADLEFYEAELTLRLALFDVYAVENRLAGFDLVKEARRRAKNFYEDELRRPADSLVTTSFTRFWLELSYLRTARANESEVMACYAYYDVLHALTTLSPN